MLNQDGEWKIITTAQRTHFKQQGIYLPVRAVIKNDYTVWERAKNGGWDRIYFNAETKEKLLKAILAW